MSKQLWTGSLVHLLNCYNKSLGEYFFFPLFIWRYSKSATLQGLGFAIINVHLYYLSIILKIHLLKVQGIIESGQTGVFSSEWKNHLNLKSVISCLWISMQSYTSPVVEAGEEASMGKERQPARERASCRRRGTQKRRMESSFQKGGKWEREGQQQQWKGEGEEGRTAAFPPSYPDWVFLWNAHVFWAYWFCDPL